MKLVVNMIMGAFMVSSAEGLELAKGVGLKEEDLIEVVNMAAIATPMFKLKVRLPVLVAAALIACWAPALRRGWRSKASQCMQYLGENIQGYAACTR